MAPVIVSALGVTIQTIDDPALKILVARLSSFATGLDSDGENWSLVDVPNLVSELSNHSTWRFQEQADLYEWISALNAIDAALWQLLDAHPGLILIGAKESGIIPKRSSFFPSPTPQAATSITDVFAVPSSAVESVLVILKFLSSLLRNSTNKVVFNSVEQLALLLSASSDDVAALAIETLYNLAIPPFAHKQQMPDMQQHHTALHTASPKTHECVLTLARGWGSRGSGLGLQACVTYDDAQQASLPTQAGEVYFETLAHDSQLLVIHITSDEMLLPTRPRPTLRCSTAQVFFDCFHKIPGGRDRFPPDKLFSLLASIRLARSYHTQATRVACVKTRLNALIAAIHSDPSVEILSGYFQAQPELCSEIADLSRPITTSSLGGVASCTIPHSIRILAVEALTALVCRRDGVNGNGGLSPIAKHVSVLVELGVGKGQYAGLLPTLIRFSVASLSANLPNDQSRLKNDFASDDVKVVNDEELAIGIAFIKAASPEPTSKSLADEYALDFIDAVLTLIMAVVTLPSGAAALTDCGLVPALIGAVALEITQGGSCLESHRVFITAQAVQILEQAIVTHSPALATFLEMNGIDLLVSRLYQEVIVKSECSKSKDEPSPLTSSRRVLIFSVMNCLTVAFHHQQSNSTRSPAFYMRKDEMAKSLICIMDNISSYGGLLASLCATLLWDVMNADPQLVHHAHNSGLATSFLSMVMGNRRQEGSVDVWDSKLPASSELIMALPNVLSALALTEDGARIVKETNPFPSMLSIFCSPLYVMPQSRCLLNDMTSIVGTGVDELMRHVPSLRPLVIEALVGIVKRIVTIGENMFGVKNSSNESGPSENSRTLLMQYALNISQLLEQTMQNGDHVTPFIDSGGFEALLQLYPLLLPWRERFLTHISCLSSPCSATLTHYSASNSLLLTIKNIASNYEPQKLPRLMNIAENALNEHLDVLEDGHLSLRKILCAASIANDGLEEDSKLDIRGILSNVPILPIHVFQESSGDMETLAYLSFFLRQFIVAEWFVNLTATLLRVASQRSQEMSHVWSGSDREPGWKAEICSPSFAMTLRRITRLTVTSQIEACRIRTMSSFEEREAERHKPPGLGNSWYPAKYRLRIVCQDGAVVRDGIEIDSCASIGNMEIGETVEAYDRCINSSGVMRYCTSRGWISEHTRGHSKEPIAEVLSVQGIAQGRSELISSTFGKYKIINCGIPDLQVVSASILSRFQGCRKNLLSCLSRTVAQSVRSLPLPQRFTSQLGTYVGTTVGLIVQDLNLSFDVAFDQISPVVVNAVNNCEKAQALDADGICMYFGSLLELAHACLFDEKRERRILNIPILLSLLSSRGFSEGFEGCELSLDDACNRFPSSGLLGAIRFVLKHSLHDMSENSIKDRSNQVSKELGRLAGDSEDLRTPRVSRCACASLPPTLALLSRLLTRSLFTSSHMWHVFARMKKSEVIDLIGFVPEGYRKWQPAANVESDGSGLNPGRICRGFHCALGQIVDEMLTDRRITCVPAHLVHPILGVVGDVLTCLEEDAKPAATEERPITGRAIARGRLASDGQNRLSREGLPNLPVAMSFLLSEAGRNLTGSRSMVSEPFEPSEETLARLVEMGFSREHALEAIESTESNRLEIAMEYALSHPPSSPGTIERRRLAQEERSRALEARQREAQTRRATGNNSEDRADLSGPAPTLEAMDCEECPPGDLSSMEKEELRKKELESRSVTQTQEFLKTMRADLAHVCLDIIAGGSTGISIKPEGRLPIFQWSSPLPDVVFERFGRLDDGKGNGDVEAEALTKVVCKFLLDQCTRYPSNRSEIVESILKRLVSLVSSQPAYTILTGHESDFASLCHAAAILLRALPRTRPLVLQYGFVNIALQCIRVELHSSRRRGKRKADTVDEIETTTWPRWMSPILLLLEVMLQPIANPLPSDSVDYNLQGVFDPNGFKIGCGPKGEFTRMCSEKKAQEGVLAQTATDIFSAVNGKLPEGIARRKKSKSEADGADTNLSIDFPSRRSPESQNISNYSDTKPAKTLATMFPTVPCYMSSMPMEEAEICMTTSLKILRVISRADQGHSNFPPNVVHSALLLLARVLRSPELSSQCLLLGGAELLLSLPPQCRFTGNVGLVTVIMRHLLEDDVTLRCAMETEIRSSIVRLQKQQGRALSGESNDRPVVRVRSFVQAVAPLICRDPICFLKAAATSIMVKMSEGGSSSGVSRTGSDNNTVSLLTSAERNRNLKAINEMFASSLVYEPSSVDNQIAGCQAVASRHRDKSQGNSTEPRFSKSRSPHHHNHTSIQTPSVKKTKKEKHKGFLSNIVLNGSPSNHIIGLLLTELIRAVECEKQTEDANVFGAISEDSMRFLLVVDYLEVLADLVLAVPACAAAIHRYRPPHGNPTVRKALADIQHSLNECSPPPSTAVSYILHMILPQPRPSELPLALEGNDQTNEDNVKRRKSFMQVKLAQASARLLVALCARPGEGRRRVVVDLVCALGGGRGKSIVESSLRSVVLDSEMWAILSWAELCIGLAAPKSSGVSSDSNSTLSWEVTKLMLQYGIPHAVMQALQRVNLNNPLASKVAGALLRPLEVFTRGSVIDTVADMMKKEVSEKEEVGKKMDDDNAAIIDGQADNSTRRRSSTPRRMASPGSEVAFSDDAMLEDGFDPYTADRARQHAQRRDIRQMSERIDSHEEFGEENDDEHEDNEPFGSEPESVIDIMEEAEDYDEDADSHNDGDLSSGESTNSEDDGTDEDSESESGQSVTLFEETEEEAEDHAGEGDSEENEEDSDEEESDSEGDSEQSEEWGDDEDQDFFEGSIRGDVAADDNAIVADAELDEGWTRVESAGFPGGVLMARQPRMLGDPSARQRGFVVDAAESVLGNILRASDIRAEALEELEDTLGIRISHRGDIEGFARGPSGRFGLIGVSSSSGSVDAEAPIGSSSDHGVTLSYGDRGSIGSFPAVRQMTSNDAGHPLSLSGRSSDVSAVDAAFSENGPFTAPLSDESRQNDCEQNGLVVPDNFETQLFPGGPAAATHTRTQRQIHSLLLDVDLPQPNVRFFYRPSRSRVAGQGSSQATFFGGLFSGAGTSQVLRLNRDGVPFLENASRSAARNFESESRWTDDGLPLDIATGDFSVAFEQALAATMMRIPEEPAEPLPELNPPIESGNGVSDETSEAPPGLIANSSEILIEISPTETMDIDQSDNRCAAQDELVAQENAEQNINEAASRGDSNEGERVAQSLASGLHLSPQSESGNTSMEDTAADAENLMASSEATAYQGMTFIPSQLRETGADSSGVDQGVNETSDVGTAGNQGMPNEHGLLCPPGMDQEVFNCLPLDMQQEVLELHRGALEVAAQLDSTSGLDPEALAALPEDMRREIILQDQQDRERMQRQQQTADPSNAEDMDNASFLASLAPDLREEILLTADDTFLSSLPPDIIAEAQILRDRASSRYRQVREEQVSLAEGAAQPNGNRLSIVGGGAGSLAESTGSRRRQEKHRTGRIRVDSDRSFSLSFLPGIKHENGPFITDSSMKMLIRLLYLLSPVRPHRLLQKLFQNLCYDRDLRKIILTTFVCLLHSDSTGAIASVKRLPSKSQQKEMVSSDIFPPVRLIGTAAVVLDTDVSTSHFSFRRRPGYLADAAMAANLPAGARGSSSDLLPPVVARRLIDTLLFLSKNAVRVPIEMAGPLNEIGSAGIVDNLSCLDTLFDLIGSQLYSSSSTNLEQLLSLIECVVAVMCNLPKAGEPAAAISQNEIDAATEVGKEWVVIPRPVITQYRLRTLCSVLRLESSKDGCFQKVNSIARRVSLVEENRTKILFELASVAQGLAADAIRDLKTLTVQLNHAAKLHQDLHCNGPEGVLTSQDINGKRAKISRIPASAVTLSSSSSEIKLLRVLQTLHSLCGDTGDDKKIDGQAKVSPELVSLLHSVELESLWQELSGCLRIVSVLEGLGHADDETEEGKDEVEEEEPNSDGTKGKKLQSGVAGLLTRLLPTIEAYFMVNSSCPEDSSSGLKRTDKVEGQEVLNVATDFVHLVSSPCSYQGDGLSDRRSRSSFPNKSLVAFVASNKVLLNALLRANPSLLEKGLKAMVEVPQCRAFMDFDVKRHWFKAQVRRLRQHASRRHGSLRLNIRRKNVFEDAFHQLRLRNSEEMKGRLHITFKNEEGVDAGGLTREFFAILAKEMFNPNYALFTSTEDGCTFQPNPNSSINPDHLSYFRFVGRIVGKAVLDGFLLDAHFTRSLYKHMLGVKPTHHDMQAIDPGYYKNLQMVLQYNLEDIGLDLTFSTEDHSFGRSQTIDLIPNGRNIPVTEDNKEEYVKLVCQHRMTTSIQGQIKAYLDGFYELIKPELISIFTAKELELLISGLPDIDIGDLQANTDYQNYKPSDPQIIWFWNIMFSLTKSEKAAFLQFVTGSSKVPLEGFSQLQGMRGTQKFSIHRASGSNAALISAHTCFNALDLPVYSSEEEMREKILYAINEGAEGFLFA